VKTKILLAAIASAGFLAVVLTPQVKAASYDWNGSTTGGGTGSSNVWDTNTTANWTGSGTLWPASGTDDDAVFSGTAGTVTIAGGVTANDLTFNTTGYTLSGSTLTLNGGTTPTLTIGSGSATISSIVAGSSGLAKSGTGTVTLSAAANTYTGATAVNAGALVIDATTATGHSFFNSSGYAIASGATLQLQSNNASVWRWTGRTAQITGAGTFLRTGSAEVYFGNPTTSLNQSAGGLANFQGGTSRYVTTQSTNLGGLTIDNSTVFSSGNVYFDALNGNGTFNSEDVGTLFVGMNGGNGTFSGTINGSGSSARSLTKQGSGTQTFSGRNLYTGNTTVNGGTLFINVGTATVGTFPGAIIVNSGTVVIDATAATSSSFLNSSGYTIASGATLELTSNNATLWRWSGINAQITGAGTFLRTGSAHVYFGNPTVSFNQSAGGLANFQGGTSRYVQTQTTNLGGLTVNGATITLSGTGYFDALSGNGTINSEDAGSLVVGVNGGNGTFSGSINGSTRSLTKQGSGTQTLSGANTYGGGTTVSAGTLLISNTAGSGAGTGSVVVNGGKIGGSGAFAGALTINAGGTLSPGSSIQSLASGSLTLNNNSTFEYEVDQIVSLSVGADLQKVTGALTLSGTVTLTMAQLAGSAFAQNTTTFTLINYTGLWNGGFFTFNGNAIADGGIFTAGLNTWQLDYDATSGGLNFTSDQVAGKFVNITAVPEPATWALLAGSVTILLVMRRRRVS